MNDAHKFRKYFTVIICWTARILAALLASLVSAIFVSETLSDKGPGNPFSHHYDVQLEFAAILTIWTGMIVGWKWQGLGGLLIIGGMTIFHFIEGRFWINWVFGLFGLVGVLFLLCRYLKTKR